MGTNKWMIIPDMGYVIANRYNVIVVCLSHIQSTTIFSLMNKPRLDFRNHRIVAIGHINGVLAS